MAPPADTRERILSAAVRLLAADPHRILVLDDVAREAEISKGGLLHHFRTKHDLYAGIIEHYIVCFENAVRHRLDADPVEKGRYLRAYMASCLDEDVAGLPALTAVVSEDQSLLKPFVGRYRHWLKQCLADGVPATDALIVFYAVEGIAMDRLLGFPLAPPADMAALTKRLVSITRGEG